MYIGVIIRRRADSSEGLKEQNAAATAAVLTSGRLLRDVDRRRWSYHGDVSRPACLSVLVHVCLSAVCYKDGRAALVADAISLVELSLSGWSQKTRANWKRVEKSPQ